MIRSVSAAALLLAGAAFAQAPGEAPPFPVQNDLPEGWEMNGAPVPLDILGVKIGMARAEAQAAAVAGMEVDASAGRLEEEETGISGDYGISAFFRYPWGVFVEKSSADSSDSLSLTLSTGVSGERVIAATRETRWQGEAQPPARRPHRVDPEEIWRAVLRRSQLVEPRVQLPVCLSQG